MHRALTKKHNMANVIASPATVAALEYQVYMKPLLEDPMIDTLPFDFIVGKFLNRELYFNTQLDKISYKKVACGWDFKGGATFTKKTITPVEIAAPVEQCYRELINTIFAQGLPDGWERGTLSPEVINFMREQQRYAFNRDLLTILFLGDEAHSNPYYAIKDGIYKKLAEGVAAVDGTVDAGVTLDATTLSSSNFFNTMYAVYDKRTRFMRSKDRLVWIWTESVHDAYLTYLEKSTQGTAGVVQREHIEEGIDSKRFLGIDIVVVSIVDERLEADFVSGSPAAVENPYRVILTDPTNHKVLLDGNGFTEQEVWYEKKDDKYYLAGSALFEYEYGYGDLNVVAGFVTEE